MSYYYACCRDQISYCAASLDCHATCTAGIGHDTRPVTLNVGFQRCQGYENVTSLILERRRLPQEIFEKKDPNGAIW